MAASSALTMHLWGASTRYFLWMSIFRDVHPGHKLFCMESSLRSDVWLNDSTTTARVDTQYRIFDPVRGSQSLEVSVAGNLRYSGCSKLSGSKYDMAAQVSGLP